MTPTQPSFGGVRCHWLPVSQFVSELLSRCHEKVDSHHWMSVIYGCLRAIMALNNTERHVNLKRASWVSSVPSGDAPAVCGPSHRDDLRPAS
jgi:hypothetical protein